MIGQFVAENGVSNDTTFSDLDEESARKMDADINAVDISDGNPNITMDSEISESRFEIIDKGTGKGKQLLYDKEGFNYCVKCRINGTTYWRCCVRNQSICCMASVKQTGETFTVGKNAHNHSPLAALKTVRQVVAQIKAAAQSNVFEPAGNVVDNVLSEIDSSKPLHIMPSIRNLSRAANHHRRRLRPKEPTTLSFDLDREYIQADFIIDDIKSGQQRHLLFASSHMLSLLGKAKRWYVDGTFKVVKAPFAQLYSFHTFVRHDGGIKQVPLCFVLMSSRRKSDYKAVLRSLMNKFPTKVSVKEIISDFEASFWSAVKKVLPNVKHKGCVFHWTQAVWRHMQHVGLAAAYLAKDTIHRYCRRILSLPFLPASDIPAAFSHIKERATSHQLLAVINYVEATWIQSSLWPPQCWSIYRSFVRTNNDVESWHARLNRKAVSGTVPLYKLIDLLYKESLMVELSMKLLSGSKGMRKQRKTSKHVQSRLESLWNDFAAGNLTRNDLLKSCSRIYPTSK